MEKKEMKGKSTIIGVLALIVVVLAGLCIYLLFIKKKENKYNNTFVYDANGSYGIAYAKGYAKVIKEYYCETVPVAECNATNASSIDDVLYFYVVSTESEDLEKEINDSFGEQHKDNKSFQLGCVKDGIISYKAIADDFYNSANTGIDDKNIVDNYWKNISISKEDSHKIISSSEDNYITLKLEKSKYTHGSSDGVTCASRMTGINVVD